MIRSRRRRPPKAFRYGSWREWPPLGRRERPQGVEIGRDIAAVAIAHAKVGHAVTGCDLLGALDPADHIVRLVRQLARDLDTFGDPVEGRADLAARSLHALDFMAGTA